MESNPDKKSSGRKIPLTADQKHIMKFFNVRFHEAIANSEYSSVEDFADKNDISLRTINSYFESSPRIPSITMVAEIASLLNTSIDKLVGNDEAFEIESIRNVSAETYLRNIYRVICECGLEIKMENNHTYLKSNNEFLQQFLRQMALSNSTINDVVSRYKDLKVYNGQLYSRVTYDYLTSEEYQDMQKIYADIDYNDANVPLEDTAEYERIKKAILKKEKSENDSGIF